MLPRVLVIMVGAASVVITLAGVRAIAFIVGPVFLALVIVVTASPVQVWLLRKGWPRWLTTVALVIVVYLVMVGLVFVVIVSLARLATLLPQYASRVTDLLKSVTDQLAQFGVGQQQLREVASSLDFSKLAGFVGSLLSGIGGVLTNLVFLLALLLFLSTEATWADQRLGAIDAERPWLTSAFHRFATGTRSYMLVTTVFGFIVAVLDTGALALIGIPVPILWGLLAFVTNYIPNVGFVLGVIPPALLGLLDGGWQKLVIVVVVYCALNFVVQSLIQPRFVAGSVGLSTLVTVLALVFWSWLLGPVGAILAVPLTLLIKALFVDIDPTAGWADALIGMTGKRNRPQPGAAETEPSAEPAAEPATEPAAEPVTEDNAAAEVQTRADTGADPGQPGPAPA
ncbi:AI-2E family transporter [Amycolatopsis rhabdoformis]|uniref:AI-2E family transporter n=2 Tax=Amycolatopsis rhabdoformis TaxID=1448059 RepID=A0ABZ1INE2_9PSEU|nr:AI-2E family transporter [Amycolatopsis rhabdoformis]WSE35196.1 AI-2E family transporter [Amycolatopsis rhabdoformis]